MFMSAKEARRLSDWSYREIQKREFEDFRSMFEKAFIDSISKGHYSCFISCGNYSINHCRNLIIDWLTPLGYEVSFDNDNGETFVYISWSNVNGCGE